MNLTQAQSEALRYVESSAHPLVEAAKNQIDVHVDSADASSGMLAELMQKIRSGARIELNFHPDRLVAAGRTVAEQLLLDGRYRSQFETQISNGSLSAHHGGQRFNWEQRMFGGAYDSSSDSERPKYGALNLMDYPEGSAPRFGSCYFGLRPGVSQRATFCYGDSVTCPSVLSTHNSFEIILSAILHDAAQNKRVLGSAITSITTLLQRFRNACEPSVSARFNQPPGRSLDDYVEAQIHGEVLLERDVEFLTADPSFLGTRTEQTLREIAERYHFPVYFHRGFIVETDAIPEEFRGPEIPRLARRLSLKTVTANDIGVAAAYLMRHPETWRDWGTVPKTLQHLKQLWHVLVQYGKPLTTD